MRSKAIFLSVLLLAACGSEAPTEGDDTSVPIADTAFTATIDKDRGRIELPVDKYRVTDEEQEIFSEAGKIYMLMCLQKDGYVDEYRESIPEIEEDRRYGRWSEELAQQFGYTLAATPAKQAVLDSMGTNKGSSEIPIEAFEKCGAEEDYLRFFPDESTINTVTNEVDTWELMVSSQQFTQVLDEWKQCLKENGLDVQEDGDTELPDPVGADYENATESSIKVALIDVKCKESTDFVQRLANIEASYQGPVVKKYENELVAYRDLVSATIVEAKEFIAEHAQEVR